MKNYYVKHIRVADLKEEVGPHSDVWAAANEITDFTFPWEADGLTPSMSFKAFHDSTWLYWMFTVRDADIKVFVDKNDKHEVILGDRVEIFFCKDESLASYYCLEIDPLARVYDYHASYYRKFDSKWSWAKGHLFAKAQLQDDGYNAFGRISLQSLIEYNLLEKGKLRCGLYRGKCIDVNNEDAMKWISWVKPDSPTPDFHIPSSFGVFHLERH